VRSPTAALLWAIWHQHRLPVAAIAGLTLAGRLVDVVDKPGSGDTSPLTMLSGMIAFLILFAVFNYTDAGGRRGPGRFPQQLFTRPVTSLRLVALPVLAGIVSVELLYLLWMEPFSRGGSASRPFVAILFAALMVLYLSVLWTLSGSTRLLILGAIATAVFGVGVLPSFPPSPPPPWRSEAALAAIVVGIAIAAFLRAWTRVAQFRAGGGRRRPWLESAIGRIADARPRRMRPFDGPAAAHFWFEWRCTGLVLPGLVGMVVLLFIAPVAWLARADAGDTLQLLFGALATPIVLAIPVGMAFAKPAFWSEDTALPAFVAIRPLSADDLVATKVRVAAVSTALTWLVVIVFLAVWLSMWANLDSLSRLAVQLWAFHGHSVLAVYGIAALVIVAAMLLTWRFLVSRFWSGLAGSRTPFVVSVVAFVVVAIATLVFDASKLPGWLLADPARLTPVVWIAGAAVIAKYGAAAYAWRHITPRYVRAYLPIWLVATTSFVALALVVCGIVRIYVPTDIEGLRSVMILVALTAVPLARLGLSPSRLERNRHR
jgi:hypothetical protein